MIFKHSEWQTLYCVSRQFVYLGLVFGFIFGLHFFAEVFGQMTFRENGIVENLQLGLLIGSAIIFAIYAYKYQKYRQILSLLLSCCLLAACRELDKVFDEIVPVVHWKFAFIFPVLAGGYAYKYRLYTKQVLFDFFRLPAFYMMYTAVIIIFPIAQCIGHASFVRNVLGVFDVASIKEFYEEAAEVVGYFVIFLSALEMHFNIRHS